MLKSKNLNLKMKGMNYKLAVCIKENSFFNCVVSFVKCFLKYAICTNYVNI